MFSDSNANVETIRSFPMNQEASSDYLDAIAVIGMAGQFPGAKNIDSFWENLRNGIESIFTLNNDDLIAVGIAPEVFQDTNYIKAKGILENIELFDASFFGFNPKEAEITDPQHRIFLECASEALENAGYNSEIYPGKIGVYAGLSQSTYLLNNLITNRELIDSVGTYQIWLGNDRDFLATLVSYKLNLTGPSVVVQTACSTSLVAIHYACQSLIAGESDIALAGGVSIAVPHRVGYTYQKGGIFAFDGHCRAFDAEASGTVGGNGAGIVVLKRLEDALADRDCIHAVIRGSAINNDGAVKVGYTAPSIEGQAKAIAETYAVAGVEPESITYIETHGTGTVLGDPIEIAALNKVFRASTQKTGFCAIGSVKTNIGHLDTAAGIAGFIKTVLALKYQQIPPSLHFSQPNPQIDFANSPFYVNTTLSAWQTNDTPRRAGVSSFGIGGTNAHVVLEEAPLGEQGERGRDYLLLCLSAKTKSALEQTTANLIRHLQQHPDVNLADVAYTLGIGRRAFNYRRVLVCKDVSDAVTTLVNPDSPQVLTCYQERRNPPVAFMFPGQGTQYVKMGWEVYQTEPTFKEAVDICSEMLKPHLGLDLCCVLYPSQEETELASQQLNQTAIAQPAIFTIEYALSQLLMSWGIHPQVMIGHSIGEYIAAHLAGVFSLKEALALVAARGQLMQQMPPGSMLAVSLAAEEVQPLLSEECAIAAINAPSLCVVSGTMEAIAQLERQLIENSIKSRRLHTSHAFHSPMMKPILEAFGEQVKKVNFQPPKIPYISNVTGTWITTAQATDPNYWVQHLRSSVQFAKGVQLLLQESDRLLLEVGAGNTLSTFAKLSSVGSQAVLTTLPHAQNRQSDSQYLLTTIGQLWMAGIDVDWTRFYQYEQRYRVPLPTYPFERQRYWIEPQKSAKIVESKPIVLNKKPDIADWFYMPCWKQSAISQSFDKITSVEQNLCWLVFVDESSFGSRLVQRLKKENQYVITVSVGEEFKKVSQDSYTINPRNSDDYHALFKELNKIPHKILHLWSVTKNDRAASEIEFFEKTQDLGFYSLLFLAQALGKQHLANSVEIGVVSSNMQPVTGEEILCPEKATVLGLCLVIPQEYPHITCQSIDIAMPLSQSWQEEKLIDSVLSELVTKSADSMIAYRASRRWVQTFEPVQLEAPVEKEAREQGAGRKGENSIQCLFVQDQYGLREQGVYLITGGLGNIGFVLAEYLAKTVQARLILIGRSPLGGVTPSYFPARVAWQQWLDTHDPQDKISQQICKVQTLEAHGAKVIVKSADVANLEQMQSAIAQAGEIFGEINGVIHAAGLLGNEYFKTIQQITKAECEQQFHAKVHGLFVLQKILQGKPLDFCLLTSSLSSVLGGLGFVAYSAANLFMDAFTHQCNQFNVFPWLSVNWDGWKIPAEKQVNIKLGGTLAEFAIAPNEGIEVLKRVLSNTYPQVVVSTGDLKARIDQWIKQEPFKNTESVNKVATVSLHSRPDLKSAYIAPQNEIEQIITNIWQELLGIQSIGIHDDFFELGGHSLLATQVIAQMNKALQVEFSLSSLFELPTVKALSDDLAGYERWASPRWKRSQNTEKNTILPLAASAPNPEQRYQPFPLTDVQQAYWIGRSGTFELGNVATHGYIELESHGLNLERLKLAVQRLIEHHDMLRAIVLSDGQQQILKQAPTYQIEILDLRGQNSEVIGSQLQAAREQMSHQILAADRWPLFEIRASRLDNDCIRLHLSFDYLIVDAWSLGEILAPQLHQLYQNLETVLVPLEISFRDYVLAEIALRDSEVYRNSRDYWFNRLSKLLPAPELPLAKNPSSITKPHFINRSARLQPATWLQLKTRATQAGLTPSGVLLAAFAEVLSVWSKTPKFTLNLTLFNRLPLHPQVNNIVGDFTSLTLLAVDCSTSESFLSKARSLQKQLWQDLEHRHISGVEVLRELARTQGGATRAAMPVVFTSTLTQNTAPQGTSDWEKLGKVVYSISQTPQVWLDHQVSENEGALLWSWDAVEELFPKGFLDDMFAAYCRLLDSLATDESVWQSTKLQLLPPAQLKQLTAINATESPVSQAMLHTLFAGQVSRRQHQPAVITPNRTLTYEELDCLANQVAYRLRQLGVLPNTLVAVVMEKGWQQIVAVLGILQCGAAYLPIDPELPTERRWHLFQQAEVQVVLTQSWLDNTLSWPDSIQRICVDNLAAVDDILPLEPAQTPTDLAYVIYTSGSTGIPKGVMIDHRGAVNTILDINQRFGIGANDRVLALSSLSFDLSVYDIFGTLAAGGTIVIPEATTTKEPAHWLKLIQQHQITVWNSVPTLMQMLVEYAASQSDELPNSLRLVLLSGDRIPLNLPTQIKSLWENIQIVSLGGATEASIWSILYPIAKTDSTWNTIPYGRPLTNQRFYVFNQALTECPVWVPGQLYIGGVGLAQGYWRDQKKTNASFIIHPQTKERLYKTGDLGRYLPDGNIEFLGREDFQVKINGYRIELGEIEATLRKYPTVKEVVVAVGESQENQQLVAYIVPQSDLADSNQQQAEAYEPRQLPGVLLDPVERIEFKLKQKGLRQLKPSQSSIQLPKPKFDEILTQEYLQRQSYRQFQDEPISLEMFSQFLSCLLQMQLEDSPLPKYRYPSAGSLYPVQTYLSVKPNRIAGLGAGYYYYHPADHNLILLNAETSIWGNIYSGNQPIFDQSAFSLFLIGQLSAIAPMYGDLARDFCLLEAGYIGQLLMNSAPENQIGLCPIGYLDFEKYQDLLSLESDQILLHSFLGGKIDQAQARQWLQPPISRKPDSLTEDIHNFLQQKLPEYLLPSTYVFLDSLPLTPNGKVDRKALLVSEIVRKNLKEGFVAPRNHTEKTLVAIFGEILGGKEIGIHDNFFELGGDSLRATQVMTRLREAFQVDLPLRRLFDNPTVATLGDRIEALRITQVTPDITISDREQGRL
jgi:amino acid adenylation domain-containing protein